MYDSLTPTIRVGKIDQSDTHHVVEQISDFAFKQQSATNPEEIYLIVDWDVTDNAYYRLIKALRQYWVKLGYKLYFICGILAYARIKKSHAETLLVTDEDFYLIEEQKVESKHTGSHPYYIPALKKAGNMIINIATFQPDKKYGFRGALTNISQMLPGYYRFRLEQSDKNQMTYEQMIVDIFSLLSPALSIVYLPENDYENSSYMIVSNDPVCLDTILAKRYAINQAESLLRIAAEAGLGLLFSECNELPQNNLIRMPNNSSLLYQRIKGLLTRFNTSTFHDSSVQVNKCCDGCRHCLEVCPTNAITIPDNESKALINNRFCVTCLCCFAHCPVSAIETVPVEE